MVHCLAMQDQQHYLLNVLELLEGTGIDGKSLDSRNIVMLSSLLSLLPELKTNLKLPLRSIVELLLLPALFDDVAVVDCSVASSRD